MVQNHLSKNGCNTSSKKKSTIFWLQSVTKISIPKSRSKITFITRKYFFRNRYNGYSTPHFKIVSIIFTRQIIQPNGHKQGTCAICRKAANPYLSAKTTLFILKTHIVIDSCEPCTPQLKINRFCFGLSKGICVNIKTCSY